MDSTVFTDEILEDDVLVRMVENYLSKEETPENYIRKYYRPGTTICEIIKLNRNGKNIYSVTYRYKNQQYFENRVTAELLIKYPNDNS